MDSEVIVALIGAAVTAGNVLYTSLANRRSNVRNGLQCLLRSEIIRAHDKYTTRGFCPIYAKESLTKAYNAYHNLGGNDVATELYRACIMLPDKPREENDDED